MQRIKLTIEYDGTNFHGWQAQNNLPTIQFFLERSLEKFFCQKIEVFVAGRTDKGVHSIGQVCHFDIDSSKKYNEFNIILGLNRYLRPEPISIINCEFVNDIFHARFSAIQKSYIYKIINRSPSLTFQKNYAWHVIRPLNIEKMTLISKFLIGKHDFSSFCSADSQSKSFVRTIDNIIITNKGNEILIEFQAKSFLHNQVRIMIGTLKKIGLESSNLKPEDMQSIIDSKDRRVAGETAPSSGLFLNWIKY